MSLLTVQQQSIVKSITLPKISQNRLPIVHILTSRTDNDDERKVEPFQFEKIIKFFQDPLSSHLIDRRVRLCNKICQHHKNGYILKDLHYLMKIFNMLVDLCQQQPLFINPFIEILKNCSKPFLLDKSTDAEIYASALVSFYSDFGYLLRIPNKSIQQCILETLYKSIQTTNKSPRIDDNYDDLTPAPHIYLLRTQCSSDLCETLVK
ncbi:unnamed protein product, partial [Rotaria magnacalcarata]